jgi:hypothetical protein
MKKQSFNFMIQDWAGNEIFGVRNGLNVELRFETFDDAEEHLSSLLGDDYEESRGEYYVIDIRGEK